MKGQARSWPGGPKPPEILKVTFLNRVNLWSFCVGLG